MTHRPPIEPKPAALEHQIRQVELRLIAREQRLWRGVAEVRSRARDALSPRRLLRPLEIAGGLALAGTAAWWLLRRSGRPHHPAPQRKVDRARWRSRVVAAVGLLTAVPWAPVMHFFWPLLPTRLRKRSTPGGAAATLSVTLPWVARFASPNSSQGLLNLGLTSFNAWCSRVLGMQQRTDRSQPAAPVRPA